MSNQDTTEPFVLNDEDMDKFIKYNDKIKIMDKWINEMSKDKFKIMFKELDLHEITEKHKNIFKKSKDQKISIKTRLSYYLSTEGRRIYQQRVGV